VGRVLFIDTLSITLVVFGPPFGGLVCLEKCRDDVVDCSCESTGQSVYGSQIGFLGPFGPFWCKTNGGITSSHVAVSNMPIYDGFLDVYVFGMLHVLYIYIYIKIRAHILTNFNISLHSVTGIHAVGIKKERKKTINKQRHRIS
jgi:hypothetical protein